jgi:hypothetical protein
LETELWNRSLENKILKNKTLERKIKLKEMYKKTGMRENINKLNYG